MEFPRSEKKPSVPSPEDEREVLRKKIEELEAANRTQDSEIGLHEWNREILEQEHGVDHLTGADTRKAFEAKLGHAFENMSRKGEQRHGVQAITEASLIFIDLDNFKKVNDSLGHAQGDEVLKKAASLLRGALREEDILGRFGGDEFVVLLLNADEGDAAVIAEKLRAALDNDPELKELEVTGSLGVSSVNAATATSPEVLIKNADDAVYAAKNGGRNRVEAHQGA